MSGNIANNNNGIYQDLGLILPVQTLADGQYAKSDWFDEYYWVRKFLIKMRCNKAWSLHIWRKSSDGNVEDWGETIDSSSSATGTSTSYANIEFESVGGYSFQIGIRNNNGSAEDATIALSVEVFK